jgi:D-sedoheptulose 7-phosphate isomerase
MKKIFESFLKQYQESMLKDIDVNMLISAAKLIKKMVNNNGKIIFAGNGGSAAMSSHVSVDFTKNASIRSINFNEADLITCFANDYGYENWITKALEFYSEPNDLVVLISSSGSSMNVLNAAEYCNQNNIDLITLSGFSKDNSLKKLGKINFWVDSGEYNVVEMVHHIILLLLVDGFINEN